MIPLLSRSHECPSAGWRSESGSRERQVTGGRWSYRLRRGSCIVVQSELVPRVLRQLSLSIPEGTGRPVRRSHRQVRPRKFRYAGSPMTEATTLPLSAHRDFLTSAGARLVLPDHSDLLRAFDKNETTRLAASLGARIPKTVLVTTAEQARDAAQSMPYPVVLKPAA